MKPCSLGERGLLIVLAVVAMWCGSLPASWSEGPPPLLLALQLFNAEVAADLTRLESPPRVFVGAQLNEDTAAISWTKCVPESNVFVVQLSARALGLEPAVIRHAAAHEVCHTVIHAETLCSKEYASLTVERQKRMEREAEECAFDMLSIERVP